MVQAKTDANMKSCVGCKYAEWEKRRGGGMHPNGKGRCEYPYRVSPIPQAFYWVGYIDYGPKPSGGYIERRKEWKDECIYYEESSRI